MTALVEKAALCGILARAFGPSGKKAAMASYELGNMAKMFPTLNCINIETAKEDEIAIEHVRLFERAECPPYESSYRDKDDEQKDVILSDVAGFYRAFGMMPSKEYPDHIVSELEFLGLLFLKEAHLYATGKGEGADVVRKARRNFVASHMAWARKFSEALEIKSRLNFYISAGRILEKFVADEIHENAK